MELENTNRIIGDFFEINSDIVYNEHTSKFPKFIARLISKYYRNKLIKKVDELSGNNMILETENVSEIFAYLYSSFPPKGKFGCIRLVSFNSISQTYTSTISFNVDNDAQISSISGIITIDPLDPGMSIQLISYNSKNESKGINIQTDTLSTNNPMFSKVFEYLNYNLIETMKEYIKINLLKFNNKEKKYGL